MTELPLQVRFADCDIAGHIHNAVYLHYFESGRMDFFVSQLGTEWDWKKDGIILKKNTVEYHEPGTLYEALRIQVSCTHIGNTSFTLSYEIYNDKGTLKASGSSILVCFDYTIPSTKEVPQNFKKILIRHSRAD